MNHTRALRAPSAATSPTSKTYLGLTDLYEHKLRDGELVAARCVACEAMSFPPEPTCHQCQSPRQRPVKLSGRARLVDADPAVEPAGLSLGRVLFEEGIQVRAPLMGAFREPALLARMLENRPIEVRPRVLRSGGLAILAFEPAD
jgi:hypothetical protein